MSLKHFIEKADVKAKLKLLRPGSARKIAAALSVEPRSKRYMVVGSAFDYLLRFELQRRAPHAVTRCWRAELAADLVWWENEKGCGFLNLSRDDKGVISVCHAELDVLTDDESLAKEVAGKMRKVVEKAKSAHAAYLKSTSPTRAEQAELARHAIRLAKLDDLPAASRIDPTFEEATEEDVEDVLALLAIVPFNALLHDKVLLLNPVFGQTSLLVGGADADLIVGDMLVDFKTTKSDTMAVQDLDQLLGYYLLTRRQRQADPTFPAINRLALYFCRHAYLWTWDTTIWTEHPVFAETEEWFFTRANEVFKAKQPTLAQ
jgi:hypothetical protein